MGLNQLLSDPAYVLTYQQATLIILTVLKQHRMP